MPGALAPVLRRCSVGKSVHLKDGTEVPTRKGISLAIGEDFDAFAGLAQKVQAAAKAGAGRQATLARLAAVAARL